MSHRHLITVFFIFKLILSTLAAEGKFGIELVRYLKVPRKHFFHFPNSAILAAADHYSEEDSNYGVTWMYFPDGNGLPQVANLTEPPNSNGRGRSQPVKEKVRFELYTR